MASSAVQWRSLDFEGTPNTRRWPVYAGESFDLWTPDTGKYYAVADASPLCAHLQERRERAGNQARSAFSHLPEEWRSDQRTLPCRHARVALRDGTRATDSRTSRVALVPPKTFLVHTAAFLLFSRGVVVDQAVVLGVMSSLPYDWYARRFVETHMTFEILRGFPVPIWNEEGQLAAHAASLSARLATPDDRFDEWASHFRLEPRQLAADEKDDHIHELDAAVAHLYGLDERDLAHIFESFHEGRDYSDRLDLTLKHFRKLARLT